MKCSFRFLLLAMLTLFVTLYSNASFADGSQKQLTNQDVINMVKAGLPTDVIVQTIKTGSPNFDVSADGLIDLKKAGVPDSVIQAMVLRDRGTGTQASESTESSLGDPDIATRGVTLINGSDRVQMKRTAPTGNRTGGAGMKVVNPFGKIKVLATFNGNHAQLRTNTTSPIFEVWLPSDLNASDAMALVRLTVKSDHREISKAQGRIGVSAGFSKDDLITIAIDESQSSNHSGRLKSYGVRTVKPMPQGEYAIVIHGSVYYDSELMSADDKLRRKSASLLWARGRLQLVSHGMRKRRTPRNKPTAEQALAEFGLRT